MTTSRSTLAGCSSSTRGVFGGGFVLGYTNSNVIDYITIASAGNATDFGDLVVATQALGACSSSTRGVWGGGYTNDYSNVIQYVTISSVGNALDFGDLSVTRTGPAGCSNAHGGLS